MKREKKTREPELVRLGIYDTEFQATITRDSLAQENTGYLYWVKKFRNKWAVYFVKSRRPAIKFGKIVENEIKRLEAGV